MPTNAPCAVWGYEKSQKGDAAVNFSSASLRASVQQKNIVRNPLPQPVLPKRESTHQHVFDTAVYLDSVQTKGK